MSAALPQTSLGVLLTEQEATAITAQIKETVVAIEALPELIIAAYRGQACTS